MPELDSNAGPIAHYKAYVMAGNDMSPTINEGDHVVIDLSQRFIRSGDIYVIEFHNDIIVCRVLLDRDRVKLIFDGASHEIDEFLKAIRIVGRVIEIKTLDL